MQWPGTAKTHQRKVAGVIALLHRNHPQSTEHVFIDDIDDTASCRHEVDAERISDGLHRLFSALTIELETAAQQVFGQVTQHNIGIGHGREFTALAIRHRPRNRTGRLRADAQSAGQFGHISDRSTAGAHGLHVK